MMRAIGIDFGTNNIRAAVYRDGQSHSIPFNGFDTFPCLIGFNHSPTTSDSILIGEPSLIQSTRHPQALVHSIKRYLGRRYSDPIVQKDLAQLQYRLEDVDGAAAIIVPTTDPPNSPKVAGTTYFPEELVSLMLVQVRKAVSAHLDGARVKSAVITVPCCFGFAQRKAILNAATLAGWNVLRLLNETTASAIAYAVTKPQPTKRTVLVYDWGGGTFDASLCTIQECDVQVLASGGQASLGGFDLDVVIKTHVLSEFQRQFPTIPVHDHARLMRKLELECEHAKRMLSSAQSTSIDVENVQDDMDFTMTLTRATLEPLIEPFITRTLDVVKGLLKDSKLHKEAIDEIILVGSSSRMPLVKARLIEMLPTASIYRGLHPEHAVAFGASIVAATMCSDSPNTLPLTLKDVTAHTLGLSGQGGVMMPFLSRQTPLPFNKTASDCRNALDNQTKISFRVYEGEAVLTKDCTLVGEFAIIDVVPGKRGTQKFDLTFALDDNGVLSASALNKRTNDPHSVFITESCVQNVDQSFRASVYLSPNPSSTTLLPNGSSGMSRDRVTSWISLSNYMNELVSSANQKSLEGTLTDSQKHMLDLAISKEVAWLQQNRTQMDQDEIKRRHESWKLLVDRLRL